MFIAVPARPDGTPHSKVIYNILADTLGSCFVDLAKQVYTHSLVLKVHIFIYIVVMFKEKSLKIAYGLFMVFTTRGESRSTEGVP